eukprot:scaffold219142_cov28-Tisochrysis_lutea.AAC.1
MYCYEEDAKSRASREPPCSMRQIFRSSSYCSAAHRFIRPFPSQCFPFVAFNLDCGPTDIRMRCRGFTTPLGATWRASFMIARE